MSLLNDMLRDLVKHQQPTNKTAEYTQMMRREAVNIDDGTMTRFTKISFVFILVFTFTLLIKHFITHSHLYWSSSSEKSIQKNEPQKKSQDYLNVNGQVAVQPPLLIIQNPSPVQQNLSPIQQNLSPVKQNLATTDTAELLDDAVQQKIQGYLIHAKLAIGQDKLTSPIEDNAFSDYQQVLQIDPKNSEAKQGIEFIASRYIARAQEQLKIGNIQQAQAYFQRAEFIAPDYFQSTMETAAGNSSGSEIQSTNEIARAVSLEKKSTEIEKPETSQLKIAPNSGWQDEEAARNAQDFLNRHQIAEAKALLEKTLTLHSNSPKAILMLHEIYLQESNYIAADDLIKRAEFLPIDQRSLMNAQSLAAQAKDLEAIQILEQHLANADNNEIYRALLASLYHKTSQYTASVTHYQRLINQFGDKPAYWLGLALSYDGLSQPKNAEQCYQHLKKFTQLQPQVIAYIDKRLSALRVN